MSFTPFMGGKRICLGKSFVDIAIRFIVPLLYFHLDFEFVDHEAQSATKAYYSVGGKEELAMPMHIKVKNKV